MKNIPGRRRVVPYTNSAVLQPRSFLLLSKSQAVPGEGSLLNVQVSDNIWLLAVGEIVQQFH